MYLSNLVSIDFKYIWVENSSPPWGTPFSEWTIKSKKVGTLQVRYSSSTKTVQITLDGHAKRLKGYIEMKYGKFHYGWVTINNVPGEDFVEIVRDIEQAHDWIYGKVKKD